MSFKRVSPSEAQNILSSSQAALLDIRDDDSFNMGHDERAIHLTQESLPVFLANTNKETPVLVMCYHGNSSQAVAQFLSDKGFVEVYSINGGYEEWNKNLSF